MEVSTLILSITSLVVSIILALNTHFQNISHNRTNLKARYFEIIFDDIIVDIIPRSISLISFGKSGKILDANCLSDNLVNLRKKAQYFKFDDEDFYKELKNVTMDIEDYISESCNKTWENDEQADFFSNLHSKIKDLYYCIDKRYLDIK